MMLAFSQRDKAHFFSQDLNPIYKSCRCSQMPEDTAPRPQWPSVTVSLFPSTCN